MAGRRPRPAVLHFSRDKLNRLLRDRRLWEFSAEIREKTGRMVSPTVLFNYRKGRHNPSYDNAAAIAATLGVSLDELGE